VDLSLKPNEPNQLTGDEQLLPGITVRDFWAWALGDLRLNASRGMLAQFLVAKSAGDTGLRDDGWGDFDVLTPGGIRIEVKSSGYLQSWNQARPSTITFGGLWGRSWSTETGEWSAEPTARADVFVFAVHTCQDHSLSDHLNLAFRLFYVVPSAKIYELRQKSIRLNRLISLPSVECVQWDGLRDAVQSAASS